MNEVDNNGTDQSTENGTGEDAAVKDVVEMINALPAAETITEETDLVSLKDQVNAAHAAYDALSDDQKAAFNADVLGKLTALEVKISELESNDQETKPSDAVQAVVDAINALPAAETITEETDLASLKDQVNAARTAYDALTAEEKAAFDTAVLDKLTALEAKISELESGEQESTPSETVQNVIEKIDAAVELIDYTTETITATDGTTVTKTHITMLKDLDPANNAELKSLIDKEAAHEQDETQPTLTDEEAAKLSDARKAFEDAKAKYLSEGFSDAQLAARQAYDALATEEEKAQVTNYSLLTDMEANIAYIMQAVNTLPESAMTIITESVTGQTYTVDAQNTLVIRGSEENPITITDCTFNLSGETNLINESGVGFTGETKVKMAVGDYVTLENCTIKINSGKCTSYTGNDCALGFFGTNTVNNSTITASTWDGNCIGFFGKANVTFTNSQLSTNAVTTGWSYAMFNTTTLTLDASTMEATKMDKGSSRNVNVFYSGDAVQNNVYVKNSSNIHFYGNIAGGFALNHSNFYVNDSTITIEDNAGNASNSGYWFLTNSEINILSNGGHGLSCNSVESHNSKILSWDNGECGIYTTNLYIDKDSHVTLTENCKTSTKYPALLIRGNSTVEFGADLLISNNYRNGIDILGGEINILSGVITNNGGRIREDGNISYGEMGGGIYSQNAKLTISDDVQIFNNQSRDCGDDLHLQSGSISFYNITKENDAILNETQLPITGWYVDGYLDGKSTKRWKQDTQEDSYQLFNSFDENGKVVLNTVTSLKAAHAYSYNPETPVNPIKWQVSKSKTATNLDANYQSQVTLSLPAAEKAPVTDVVFVLDRSSSAGDARGEISDMMDSLLEITENSNAVINVGVVNFWYKADTGIGLTRLTKESIDSIKDAIMETSLSGTNIEAGIKAATSMLDASTTLDQNKYMVLVTDGISHAWNGANGDVMTIWGEGFADKDVVFNGANSYFYFDPEKTSFNDVFNTDSSNEKLNSTYDVPVFDGDKVIDDLTTTSYANSYIRKDEYNKYYSGVEKGVYTAAHAYANAASKYKCINLYWNVDGYPVATEFMEWTATQGKCYNITDGASLEKAFDDVERDITYLVDRGSSIVDVIGEGIDNVGNGYDFEFINDINNLNLTVGGVPLNKTTIVENTSYGFGEILDNGKYEFELTYYPDGIGKEARSQEVIAGELFRLDINVPITIDKPVQLTYTVRLTHPQTADGTYGQYDADGSEEYAGLYTNKMAILYPVDSNGVEGEQEAFQKPTVSYSISNGKPVDPPVDPEDPTPRPGGGGDEDDDTPTIINETPVPTTTIDDEDVPLTDLPEDTVTIDDEEVPLKDIPNTGDMIPVPAMVAAVISIGGIALLMKKHK